MPCMKSRFDSSSQEEVLDLERRMDTKELCIVLGQINLGLKEVKRLSSDEKTNRPKISWGK